MTIKDFAQELKEIDPRLSIVQNPNRPLIANIKLDGTDVCPIPSQEIRDEPDSTYCIELPNGVMIPHKSRREALERVHHTLKLLENPENADAFFGRNGY